MNKEKLEQLLSQPVSRKQFLLYVGSGFMALFGINAMLQNISGISSSLDGRTISSTGSSASDYSAYSGVAPTNDFINKII